MRLFRFILLFVLVLNTSLSFGQDSTRKYLKVIKIFYGENAYSFEASEEKTGKTYLIISLKNDVTIQVNKKSIYRELTLNEYYYFELVDFLNLANPLEIYNISKICSGFQRPLRAINLKGNKIYREFLAGPRVR